jgi:Asp-tRNA(Asn)/Glu-tRNA(Gln) amidotransferase A subunit family amidase
MEPLVGPDERDPTSLAVRGLTEFREPDFARVLDSQPASHDVTIGIVEEGVGRGNASETVRADIVERTEAVADLLADSGMTIQRRSIEQFEQAQVVKYCLSLPELAAHWRAGGAPYRRGLGEIRESYQVSLGRLGRAASGELSEHYRARLLAGAQVIEAHHGRHYARALAARSTIEEQFTAPFDDIDALLFPTGPTLAHSLEDVETTVTATARNTIPANVTGQPAISLPAGTIDELPVGVQLVGQRFHDDDLLEIAGRVESLIDTQY